MEIIVKTKTLFLLEIVKIKHVIDQYFIKFRNNTNSLIDLYGNHQFSVSFVYQNINCDYCHVCSKNLKFTKRKIQ